MATTLVATSTVYIRSLEKLSLDLTIENLKRPLSNINPAVFNLHLTPNELERTNLSLKRAINHHIASIEETHERLIIVDTYLAGTPLQPLTKTESTALKPGRAYFRYFSNLEYHVRFLEGRMARNEIISGPNGLITEAVISKTTAAQFSLKVGDMVETTPALGNPKYVTAQIVGIMEATNPREDYWRYDASMTIDPPPVENESPATTNLDYNPDLPPIPLFITLKSMSEAVGKSYPGTLVDSLWFIFVNPDHLKDWSLPEIRSRLKDFKMDLRKDTPGTEVFTGINPALDSLERMTFFSKAPLLILLSALVATVLFFLTMITSYFASIRFTDVTLLKTRGLSTIHLARIYAVEGFGLTLAPSIFAPFAAIILVTLAGKTPYFQEMTDGRLLKVNLDVWTFVTVSFAGLLCTMIFVLVGLLGSRANLVVLRLNESRPPLTSIMQRYHIDIGLLIFASIAFWEIQSRAQIFSGGLFKDAEINETVLIAPLLFFVIVATALMRIFPLIVRFFSGESATLLHFSTITILFFLGVKITVLQTQDGDAFRWLVAISLISAIGLAYVIANKTCSRAIWIAGILMQITFIVLFVKLNYLYAIERSLPLTIGITSIVPSQMVFIGFKRFMRVAPMWFSMSLLRMSRNPLEYTWLILLLVFITGIAVFATTIGGTLLQNKKERVLYTVPTDIRITDLPGQMPGLENSLQDIYNAVPGVKKVSPAYRATGSGLGSTISVLGLESLQFPYISWYRDDFSTAPLIDVMKSLNTHAKVDPLEITEEAIGIGLWVMPKSDYPNVSLYLILQDPNGNITTLRLGQLGEPVWKLMAAELPADLNYPLHLVSVQIFEPGFGAVATPGTIFLDDIHTIENNLSTGILEDFEGQMNWSPIVTSGLLADSIISTDQNRYLGDRSGMLSFGKKTVKGIRGIYRSPTGGPLPVAVSQPFSLASNIEVGNSFITEVEGRPIVVAVRDIVGYFPTMGHTNEHFLLADLENLLAHMNVMGSNPLVRPNEMFLTRDPMAHKSVLAQLDGLGLGRIHDKKSLLEAIQQDPLATSGLKYLVAISLCIILLAVSLGYLTHTLWFVNLYRKEIRFLKSLGTSNRQLIGSFGMEQLIILVTSLTVGTWTGLQASKFSVSSIAVTETGDKVIPPFLLVTDWALMLPTYGTLVGLFFAMQYILNRSIHRTD